MNEPTLTQYIFVPKKPKMSPGKIANQVSKVTIIRILRDIDFTSKHSRSINNETLKPWLDWMDNHGMCTIVLQVKDQTELHNVCKYLKQEGIDFSSYNDEGYTEVPAGTMTAIATGVINKEKDGWRFAKYKLYK